MKTKTPIQIAWGCDFCLGALKIIGDTITRNPAYYIIAQAPKFALSGSVRIAYNSLSSLPNVAFKTPTGKLVTILQNKDIEKKQIALKIGKKEVVATLPARAIGTIVY